MPCCNLLYKNHISSYFHALIYFSKCLAHWILHVLPICSAFILSHSRWSSNLFTWWGLYYFFREIILTLKKISRRFCIRRVRQSLAAFKRMGTGDWLRTIISRKKKNKERPTQVIGYLLFYSCSISLVSSAGPVKWPFVYAEKEWA